MYFCCLWVICIWWLSVRVWSNVQTSVMCGHVLQISFQSCLKCGAQVGKLLAAKAWRQHNSPWHPLKSTVLLIISIVIPIQKSMSSAASALCFASSCKHKHRQSVLLNAMHVDTIHPLMQLKKNVTLTNNTIHIYSLFMPHTVYYTYVHYTSLYCFCCTSG